MIQIKTNPQPACGLWGDGVYRKMSGSKRLDVKKPILLTLGVIIFEKGTVH